MVKILHSFSEGDGRDSDKLPNLGCLSPGAWLHPHLQHGPFSVQTHVGVHEDHLTLVPILPALLIVPGLARQERQFVT